MSYVREIPPGVRVRLADIDPADTAGLRKSEAADLTARLGAELEELDDLLYAAGRAGLLIVLQGMDTSGKDGLIRHLLSFINVQSCRVVPFKAPDEKERAHDFLWRVHAVAPPRGAIAIFNRSHYEDVVAVRVRGLVEEAVWRGRYGHINAFERLLADSGTIVLKFFLHISPEEQAKRLRDRETQPHKGWKLSVDDWRDRRLWDRYVEAYEDAFAACNAPTAPWCVVPADAKWFRNLAVTERVVRALRPYRREWEHHLDTLGAAARAALAAYRAETGET